MMLLCKGTYDPVAPRPGVPGRKQEILFLTLLQKLLNTLLCKCRNFSRQLWLR